MGIIFFFLSLFFIQARYDNMISETNLILVFSIMCIMYMITYFINNKNLKNKEE